MKRRHFLPILIAGFSASALALQTSYNADRIFNEIQKKEFEYCAIKFKIIFADHEFEADYRIKKIGKFTKAQLEIIREDLSSIEGQNNFVKWEAIEYKNPSGRMDILDSFKASIFETKISCYGCYVAILTSVEFSSPSVYFGGTSGKKLNRVYDYNLFHHQCLIGYKCNSVCNYGPI